MTGAFQSLGYHALMFGTATSSSAAHDFGMRRHKTFDQLNIFIINGRNFILAKMARFWLGIDVHNLHLTSDP